MELREIVKEFESRGVQCNCDFDKWEPERTTGHTFVCRIHLLSIEQHRRPNKSFQLTEPEPDEEKEQDEKKSIRAPRRCIGRPGGFFGY